VRDGVRTERENEMIRYTGKCAVPLLFEPFSAAGEEEVMEGEQRYEDGIAAEVCTKKEGAVAQARGEKEGGERRGGGTVAITSPENRLLVSCSCPDFDSLSLSIYLAPSFSLSLSFSLTVCAALVPRGACKISQSHTLFPSGGCTKRQCRQSDFDLCTHS